MNLGSATDLGNLTTSCGTAHCTAKVHCTMHQSTNKRNNTYLTERTNVPRSTINIFGNLTDFESTIISTAKRCS